MTSPTAVYPRQPALEVAWRLALTSLLVLLSAPLAPLYLVLRLPLGRPPIVPAAGFFLRAARLAAFGRPPAPGLATGTRAVLLACLLQRWVGVPLVGLAWHLDTLLYGRRLAGVRVVEPLFELSAARSGSTQLARYIEDDPRFVAPSMLQVLFPFVWVWRLAARFAHLVPAERVRAFVFGSVPAEYLQRHELDPLRTDTLEILFAQHHLFDLFRQLGPEAVGGAFSHAQLDPHNRAYWEESFLPFVDALARKALLGAPGRRLLLKGHFLAVAPALAARYPDAHFLTVVRDPVPRLRSVVNFLRHQPGVPWFAPPAWEWLVAWNVELETAYCDAERAFFQAGPRRHVVRFTDFVADLSGTLAAVYTQLGLSVAATAPTAHAHRARGGYAVDRSLEELGVDTHALGLRLGAYRGWCGAVTR